MIVAQEIEKFLVKHYERGIYLTSTRTYDGGVPIWSFIANGRGGGSPGTCCFRVAVFCENGTFIFGRSYNQKSIKFEICDPKFPQTVIDYLHKRLQFDQVNEN